MLLPHTKVPFAAAASPGPQEIGLGF